MTLQVINQSPAGSKFRDWPFIAICAVVLAWMTQPWQVIQVRDTLVLVVSVGAVFALLWWSDKYEREPLQTLMWAFLWGAFPACLFSYFLEGAVTTLSGGVIIEEGMKLIALVVIFRRGSIDSWTDGLVMGGYIGLGFAAVEDVLYAISGENAFDVLVTRGIFSIFAHTFFSGLGAVVIVIGFLRKRWWLVGVGFLLACFLHLTWNTMLAWELFAYNVAGFLFFFSFLPPAILLATAIFLRKREHHELLVEGKYAVEAGRMTEEQLWLVVDFRARRYARKQLRGLEEKKSFNEQIYLNVQLLLSGELRMPLPGNPNDSEDYF
jgi:RsiW-degrading membrane proteinase PrsW (M82 family)